MDSRLAANEVVAMLHAPVVVYEAVLVTPILVQQIQMMAIEMSLEVLAIGKLHCRIALVCLPVSTALPPSVATGGTSTITIVETVGGTKVTRHKILECMSNLVCYGRTSS